MKSIKEDLASGDIKNVYLMFGEEAYLIKQYEEELVKKLITAGSEAFNYTLFEGKSTESSKIIDACSTLPFMNDKRVVVAKNTELFFAGKKDQTESLAEYISNIPKSTVLIFIEEKVDKRNRLYKAVSSKGYCAEFKQMGENDLIGWTRDLFKKEKMDITVDVAIYFVRSIGSDMNSLKREAEKLFSYKKDEKRVDKADIDLICTKSLEAEIFELVASIGGKNSEKALEIYNNLLIMKQSPLMVLSMIARQFRMIIQCKYLDKSRMSAEQIGNTIGIRGFVVKDYIKQSYNFTNMELINAIKECAECDVKIKTGLISDRLGVEMIIMRYSH